MAMPQCCYLAKGAKRPSHTTNTIKLDRIPFDPCNSIKRFDLCPFDQKTLTYSQPLYLYDLATHIDFRVHDRTLRTQDMSLIVTGTGRFGKDVSAKTFRQKKFETFRRTSFRNVTYYLGFVFGFQQTG